MKLFCKTCFLLLMIYPGKTLLGQTNYAREGRNGIYQIYLGEAIFGQEREKFADASKLGFLRPFSIADQSMRSGAEESPIFLGPYVGKETASHMLERVKDLGYADAYIEGDEARLTDIEGSKLTFTVQVGAFENLDANFYASAANQPAHGILFLYEDGLYKVLAGLYPESSRPYLDETALGFWEEALNIKAFVRPFRLPFVPDED